MSRVEEFENGTRRIKPWVHPEHVMQDEPHWRSPDEVSFLVKEPAGVFRKTPRWRVHHTTASKGGTGSTSGSTLPLRRKRDALEAFEMVKGGQSIYEAEKVVTEARRQADRKKREQRQAVNPGSFP